MRYGAFVGGLICIALVVVGFAAFARADMVQDWRNPVNYPARVLAVIWNSGRLDANSPMKFGAWTVHFDSETPLVADLTELFGKPLQIGIGNPKAQITLKCSNAIVGERRCVLIFGFNPDRCSLDTYSYFDISVGQADMQLIDIPCPTALDLQR